jgi:hypothetical protein
MAGGTAPMMAAETPSECKGLQQTACVGKERCTWVKSFKSPKGRDISAFCRKKPGKRNAVEAKAAPNGVQQTATRPSGPVR